MRGMPDAAAAGSGRPDDAASRALRAQLLATEHWSLLASRSTTQSEVLVRIGMFLTLVSAALVSLALVGQASDFSESFGVFAIAVLAIVAMVGVLTQVRVVNVAQEDLMYVLAMNRLRAAYVELDPEIADTLMASTHDDYAGMQQTYYFLTPRRGQSQFIGSSMLFIIAVNSAMIGLLVAAIVNVFGAVTWLVVLIGAVIGLAYCAFSVLRGFRNFLGFWKQYRPLHPTP
jgi:membrane protein YdbS with pleckstrin-like domain